MIEEWASLKGYDFDYKISNFGNVFNGDTDRYLTPTNKDGNLQVALRCGGVTVQRSIHKLVATAFVPNPNNYPLVYHKKDQMDNYADNLAWGKHTDVPRREPKCVDFKIARLTLEGKYMKPLYDNAIQAARETHTGCSSIRRALHGVRNTAGGFQWAYVLTEPSAGTVYIKCRECGELQPLHKYDKQPAITTKRTYRFAPVCCVCTITNQKFHDALAALLLDGDMSAIDKLKASTTQLDKRVYGTTLRTQMRVRNNR